MMRLPHALMLRRVCLPLASAALFFATPLHAQRVLTSGNYVIYTWTNNNRLAEQTLRFIQQYDSLPGLPRSAPAFGRPIRIELAPNAATFSKLTAGNAPEWGAGIAVPEAGLIVLRAYGGTGGAYDEMQRVLRHELAHIALHRYLGDAIIPRWFDEGYAEWSSGELDMDGAWLLRVSFATQRAPPLDSLELSWPAMSTDARVAYLLAASVVQYLVRESGTRGLDLFLQHWRSSHSFDSALAVTYGLSLDQLEKHWRNDVKHRYGWLAVVSQTSVAFTFLAIAVLLLYLIRRDRARLAVLKMNEPPDNPAFWIDQSEQGEDIENHGQENDD